MGCCPTLVPVILGASTHTFDNFLRLAWGGPRAQLLGVLSLGLSGQHERGVVLNPPQEAPPVPPGWVYQTRPARHSPSPSPCPACKHSSVPSLSPFLAKTPRSHLHNSALPTTAVFGVRIHPVIPVSLAAKLHIRLVALLFTLLRCPGQSCCRQRAQFPEDHAATETRVGFSKPRETVPALRCSTGWVALPPLPPRSRLGCRVERSLVLQIPPPNPRG